VISGAQETKVPLETEAWQPHRPLLRYLQSLLLVGAGTLLSALVHPLFSPTNLVMIYLLTVVIAAITWAVGLLSWRRSSASWRSISFLSPPT